MTAVGTSSTFLITTIHNIGSDRIQPPHLRQELLVLVMLNQFLLEPSLFLLLLSKLVTELHDLLLPLLSLLALLPRPLQGPVALVLIFLTGETTEVYVGGEGEFINQRHAQMVRSVQKYITVIFCFRGVSCAEKRLRPHEKDYMHGLWH